MSHEALPATPLKQAASPQAYIALLQHLELLELLQHTVVLLLRHHCGLGLADVRETGCLCLSQTLLAAAQVLQRT